MKTYEEFVTAARDELAKAREYDCAADECGYGSAAQQYLRENADDCRMMARRYQKLADSRR